MEKQVIEDIDKYDIKVSDPMKLKDDRPPIGLDFLKEFKRYPEKIKIQKVQGQNNKIQIYCYFPKPN